ncbi:hypothetical protein [Jannaschia sp. 2305UL9-9]|uniref:hypothetical protein n=1 Tax=Jannaschia sp. 2305UL9-9 TaxID=3121638 RepID=UPI003527AFF4
MAAATVTLLPGTASAYQIDCAILLCLSGGWPTSAPCAAARAEFIRRVTPWPIEPPLQIWRCPMRAAYEADDTSSNLDWLLEAASDEPERQSVPGDARNWSAAPIPTVAYSAVEDFALRLAQGVSQGADIDISDPAFDFVRSIRVYHVSYARQRENWEGDCNRSASVRLGTYGPQGEFAWRSSTPDALPTAHSGLENYGRHCPQIWSHRSVFVDWRDYEGNYGFEQVNY